MKCNRMRLALRLSAGVLLPMALSGCASKRASVGAVPTAVGRARGAEQVVDRLVTQRASISVRVSDVAAAAGRVDGIVGQAGGVVAEATRTDDGRASFTLRVPAVRLEAVLDQLAELGRASDRTVAARDVTDQVFDLEARLQNKRALRERLRHLLSSTATLQEILAVEDQLARVQTDIDTLEGQLERLRTDVAMAHVSLSLERATQLGPLGYFFQGLWTGIRKLFVWR